MFIENDSTFNDLLEGLSTLVAKTWRLYRAMELKQELPEKEKLEMDLIDTLEPYEDIVLYADEDGKNKKVSFISEYYTKRTDEDDIEDNPFEDIIGKTTLNTILGDIEEGKKNKNYVMSNREAYERFFPFVVQTLEKYAEFC